MFQAPAPAENPGKFQRITQIPRNSPTQSANYAKFCTIYSHYTLRFRCLTSGRERCKIPANQPDFAQFAYNHRELREFRTLRTKLTHMLLSFRSLTIARELRKIGANQQDSAQFARILRELREFRAFRSRLIHV